VLIPPEAHPWTGATRIVRLTAVLAFLIQLFIGSYPYLRDSEFSTSVGRIRMLGAPLQWRACIVD
jgi:hypothetical protein